jgi:hypothetical protein
LLSLSLTCCLRTSYPSFLLFSFPFASSSLSLFILHVTPTLLLSYLYNFQSFLVVLTFKRSSFLIPTYFSFFFCISFISSSFPFRFRYFPILTSSSCYSSLPSHQSRLVRYLPSHCLQAVG